MTDKLDANSQQTRRLLETQVAQQASHTEQYCGVYAKESQNCIRCYYKKTHGFGKFNPGRNSEYE